VTWRRARLKWATRFGYGDTFAEAANGVGDVQVFGSNGPFGRTSRANTASPAIIIGRKGSYGKVNWSEKPCFASDTTFFVDSSKTRENLRWLYYLLQTLQLDEGSGESAVPGLSREDAYNRVVYIPSIVEQRSIAGYLDRETTRIDALITAKERLLVLLAEKRRSLITRAVTKGLNSNLVMHNSGLPWMGEIPVHWKVAGFTKYLRSLIDYRGKTPEKSVSGVFLVTARNIRNGRIDYDVSQEFVELDTYDQTMSRGKPKMGDLLFTTEAPLGQAALVDREDIALAQRVIKLDYDPSVLENEFVMFWIMSDLFQWHLYSLATGSTAVGIKSSWLHQLRNVVPPTDEQKFIVAEIKQELRKIDNLNQSMLGSIDLLHERRAALIAAVVT
jgi:type I restriction enzyme S subunit